MLLCNHASIALSSCLPQFANFSNTLDNVPPWCFSFVHQSRLRHVQAVRHLQCYFTLSLACGMPVMVTASVAHVLYAAGVLCICICRLELVGNKLCAVAGVSQQKQKRHRWPPRPLQQLRWPRGNLWCKRWLDWRHEPHDAQVRIFAMLFHVCCSIVIGCII